jgi:hypothetical protein
VSSIGIFRMGPSTLPGNISDICFYRHALALDERRVKFLPDYAANSVSTEKPGRSLHTPIKEVWFAGTHSDMCVIVTLTPSRLLFLYSNAAGVYPLPIILLAPFHFTGCTRRLCILDCVFVLWNLYHNRLHQNQAWSVSGGF